MNGHLNSILAQAHVNDLLATADRQRLANAVRSERRGGGLVTRLSAAVRRRTSAAGGQAAPAPQPADCGSAVRS